MDMQDLPHAYLPTKSTEDDSESIQLGSNKQNSGCQMSILLYNLHNSDSEKYMGLQVFDADTNFFIKKTYTYNELSCYYYNEDSFSDKIDCFKLRSISTPWICHMMYVVWTQTSSVFKVIYSYWKSIVQLLV